MSKKSKARVEGATREPNGRLSRKIEDVRNRQYAKLDREESDNLSVAVAVREVKWGLSPKDSRDQKAGSYIGRLCISGEVSKAQYEAAMYWLEDSENYSRAMSAPRQPGAIDLNATKGTTNYENVDWVRRVKARYCGEDGKGGALGAIQAAQNELRGRGALIAALYEIVLRDHEIYHLVGDCRTALNALVRYYGIGTKERKAA